MLEVPERSLGGFWDGGCLKYTSRKLHINFQVSTLLGSGPTPGFSRASSKCHPWSLWGCWRFLRGVLVVFDMVDAPRIHQGSYISIFRSLPACEVLHLLCVSRASSWSLGGRWRLLWGVLTIFDIMNIHYIHHMQGGIKFLTSCQPNFQTIISPETAGRTIQMNKQ